MVPDPPLEAVRRQRRGVRTALDGLELALASPSAGRAKEWLAGVQERVDALAAAWANHVTVTEEPSGLFDDVLAHAPRLAGRISRLRQEHVDIATGLAAVGSAGPGGDPEADVAAVGEAALASMGAIVRHRTSGSSLLYEAYFVDIDAAD